MGLFFSSLSGYKHIWLMMNTYSEINFQEEMRQQLETARASGQMETLAQVNSIGGLSGTGTGVLSGWGNSAAFWVNTSNFFHAMAKFFIPVFAGLLGLGFALGSQILSAISAFVLSFFLIYFFEFVFASGRGWVATSRPFMFALLGAIIATIVLIFGVFDQVTFSVA